MTNCAICGANLAMVGRSHRCVPKAVDPAMEVSNPTPNKPPRASAPGTYKYRDADKWRGYMRAYMRKRRAHGTV